jgi:hypothetical protein
LNGLNLPIAEEVPKFCQFCGGGLYFEPTGEITIHGNNGDWICYECEHIVAREIDGTIETLQGREKQINQCQGNNKGV